MKGIAMTPMSRSSPGACKAEEGGAGEAAEGLAADPRYGDEARFVHTLSPRAVTHAVMNPP